MDNKCRMDLLGVAHNLERKKWGKVLRYICCICVLPYDIPVFIDVSCYKASILFVYISEAGIKYHVSYPLNPSRDVHVYPSI